MKSATLVALLQTCYVRANARDLNVLASYLQTAPIIYELLNKFDSDLIRELQSNIKNYSEIVDKILNISLKALLSQLLKYHQQ